MADYRAEAVIWAVDTALYDRLQLSLVRGRSVAAMPVSLNAETRRAILVVPAGAISSSRVKPRVGPVFSVRSVEVALCSDFDQDVPFAALSHDLATESVQVIEIAASGLRNCEIWDPQSGQSFVEDDPGLWPHRGYLLEVLGLTSVADFVAEEEDYHTGGEAPGGADADDEDRGAMSDADPRGFLAEKAASGSAHQPGPVRGGLFDGARESALRAGPIQRTPVVPGLDAALVSAAVAAGVAPGDLEAYGRVVASQARGSAALSSAARGTAKPPATRIVPAVSGATDALGDAAEMDPMQRLVAALTSAFETLPGSRLSAPGDPLERLLNAASGSTSVGGDGAPAISGRRGTVGAGALRRALVEDPGHFSRFVDSQLRVAFPSRIEAGQQPSMREFLEYRSRLSGHRPTVAFAWALGGIRDALRQGRAEEALARTDVAIMAAEQVAIDGGSWVLAQEMFWELDPPYHVFNAQRPGDALRAPHSTLCDPRWSDVAISRLKELDEWSERRRKLQGRDTRSPAGAAEEDGAWRKPGNFGRGANADGAKKAGGKAAGKAAQSPA